MKKIKQLLAVLLALSMLLCAVGCSEITDVAEELAEQNAEADSTSTESDETTEPEEATERPTILTPDSANEPDESDENNPDEGDSSDSQTTEEEPEVEEIAEPAFRNYFTGEGEDTRNNGRPIAVMINNIKQALPQRGLTQADIIYEVTAEGGVTRFMAIFQDYAEIEDDIGPIRSIRPYYLNIAMAYGAIAVFAGYSEEARTVMRNYSMDYLCGVTQEDTVGIYYRDQNRLDSGYAFEHTMFTNGVNLSNLISERGYETAVGQDYDNGLRFSENAVPESGETANTVDINFTVTKNTLFTYDTKNKTYSAVQNGQTFYDENNSETISFTNLMVIKTEIYAKDDVGHLSVKLVGNGEGYYISGGKYVPISWSRESEDGAFSYSLADGSQLELCPGKTYVAIIPTSSDGSVSFS